MPSDFVAGSVLVELKAQYADLKKNIQAATTEVKGFGQGVDQTAKSVDKSGEAMGASVDKSMLKMVQRFAAVTAGMAILNDGMANLGTNGKKHLSAFSQSLEIGSDAFKRFISIAVLMPNAVGIGLGAAAAGASIFGGLAKELGEISEQMNRINNAVKAAQQRVFSAGGKSDAAALLGGASTLLGQRADAQTKALDDATTALRKYDDAALQASKDIPLFEAEMQRITEEIKEQRAAALAAATAGGNPSGVIGTIANLEARLSELSKQKIKAEDTLEGLRKQLQGLGVDVQAPADGLQTLVDRIKNLQEAQKLVSTQNAFLQAQANIAPSGDIQKQFAALGIAAPGQATQASIQANQAALQSAVVFNESIKEAMNRLSTDDETRERLRAMLVNDETISGYAEAIKKGTEDERVRKSIDNMAGNFSTAFSGAIEQGILSGEKPMKILADTGQALFSNAISTAMKAVQEQLAAAFKSAAGGSEILGGVFTGVLGVGGALLSRLGNKSSGSFGNIQSAITSSEATRGIIAGPANIAIASVGENLQRAMAPVVSRLDMLVQIGTASEFHLRKIAGSGGGGGSPGGPFPGVATDLA